MHKHMPVALILAVVAVGANAQSVSDDFDKTKIVTVRGTVEGFVSPSSAGSHFYIHVSSKNPRGTVEQWLLEGKPRAALLAAGWTFGNESLLNSGDPIVATAYALKTTVDLKRALSVLPPRLQENIHVDRLAHGIEITLSSGKTMPFGER